MSRMPPLRAHDLVIGYAPPRRPAHIVGGPLTLALDAGELVCLLGPNGAGKSTLLRTLAGMQPALEGAVALMGDPIARLSSAELAQRLAVVLTERPPGGMLTVYGLVALGRHPFTDWTGRLAPEDEAAVGAALADAGALDLADQLLDELSDGQRQKVMIARALAQSTPVLLLDEPTAFLDLPRRVEVLRLLRRLAHNTGRAVLVSTHDLDLALRTADRVWLMDGAGTLAAGAPEDLVLDGTFERAFAAEGLCFDPLSGTFHFETGAAGGIALAGDGLAYNWTRRALERAGYHHAPDAALRVEALAGRRWRLHRAGGSREYTSIYDLITALERDA